MADDQTTKTGNVPEVSGIETDPGKHLDDGGTWSGPATPENPIDEPRIKYIYRLGPGPIASQLFGDARLVGLKFSGFKIKSVRFDVRDMPGSDTYDVNQDDQQLNLTDHIQLRLLESISLMLAGTNDTQGEVTLYYESENGAGSETISVALLENTSFQKAIYLNADTGNRREELLEHLQTNRSYYTQAILNSLDPASLSMLLSGVEWNGHALAHQVEPKPLGVAGNYLILKAPVDDAAPSGLSNTLPGDGDKEPPANWGEIVDVKMKEKNLRLIPIPTAGVFAEAVLGRSNSAEKLDITRFWNWQDSPIPLQPTEIAPVSAGSRAQTENLTPGQLSSPVVNIMNPSNLPDPAGLSAVLGAVANGNMFRDMSGLEGTQAAGQAMSAGTLSAATGAGKLATENYRIATDQATEMAKTAADMWKAKLGAKSARSKSQTQSEKGSLVNLGRDIDKQKKSQSSKNSRGNSSDVIDSNSGSGNSTMSSGGENFSRGEAYADEIGLTNPPHDANPISSLLSDAAELKIDEYGSPVFAAYDSREEEKRDEEIIEKFDKELSLKFSDPNDPGLYDRRQRLKKLFEQLSNRGAAKLYGQLGYLPNDDALSKKFHRTLATPTRIELMLILSKKVHSISPPSNKKPKWNYDFAAPLPKSESGRLNNALDDLKKKLDASSNATAADKRVLNCWISKLRDPNFDDRIIEWQNICPNETGALGAAMVVGPCPFGNRTGPPQSLIESTIKNANDVEKLGGKIRIFTYMRSNVLVDADFNVDPLQGFSGNISMMKTATKKLHQWGNSAVGGSEMMPIAYRAIKDWKMSKQHENSSLYTCP